MVVNGIFVPPQLSTLFSEAADLLSHAWAQRYTEFGRVGGRSTELKGVQAFLERGDNTKHTVMEAVRARLLRSDGEY